MSELKERQHNTVQDRVVGSFAILAGAMEVSTSLLAYESHQNSLFIGLLGFGALSMAFGKSLWIDTLQPKPEEYGPPYLDGV